MSKAFRVNESRFWIIQLAEHQGDAHRDDLRHEGQGLVLQARQALEQGDGKAHDERREQDGRRKHRPRPHHLDRELLDIGLIHRGTYP